MHKFGDQFKTSIKVPISTCTYIVFVAYDKDFPFPLPKSPTTNIKKSCLTTKLIKMAKDHFK
jgi:hypothetical protein